MRHPISPPGLLRAWLTALVGSAVLNELLRSVLWQLLSVPPSFLPFSRPAVLLWTAVGVSGGAAAFALVARWSFEPVRTFRRLAAVALVLSWVPDALLVGSPRFPEATWDLAAGLASLHVVPAAACAWLYPKWGLQSGVKGAC